MSRRNTHDLSVGEVTKRQTLDGETRERRGTTVWEKEVEEEEAGEEADVDVTLQISALLPTRTSEAREEAI